MKRILTLTLAIMMVFGLSTGVVVANTTPPTWDVSGEWSLDYAGGTENREFRDMVQDEYGNVSGEFWYLSGGVWLYGGTLNGKVSGNTMELHYVRPLALAYTGDFVGIITVNGMYGTFTDSNGGTYDWLATGTLSLLVWDARVSGGGQILAESGTIDKRGNDINYKISFGGGAYIVNGEYWLDGLEVTFHNVSITGVKGGKFVATSLTHMNFNFNEGVANYTVLGEFNEIEGYKMIVRVEDSGEPGCYDNIRFELFDNSAMIYDSFASDFPGESNNNGTARTYLDRGNIQVEDLRD